MNTENQIKKICPACGFEIEQDEHIEKKTLCYYCWYRAQVGTAKFILFHVMQNTGNNFRTPEEITKEVNKFRVKHGKPEIKTEAVYQILHRYSKHYEQMKQKGKGFLVLVKSIKTKRGRPIKKYKLSARLDKRVTLMEKRWMSGLTINMKIKGKDSKRIPLNVIYAERARVIELKIKKEEYEPYRYMIRD